MSRQGLLVQALETVLRRLESDTKSVDGTVFLSAQHALGDISEPLWHVRRGHFVRLRYLALLFAAAGPLERIAASNGWPSEFRAAQQSVLEILPALNRIRYFASETAVELGDQVSLRLFFKKEIGRVTYLPGTSPQNDELDFGGICRVGIQTPDGTFVACHVDNDTLELKKNVLFRRRDASPVPPMPAELER